jgi:hypothetical protein
MIYRSQTREAVGLAAMMMPGRVYFLLYKWISCERAEYSRLMFMSDLRKVSAVNFILIMLL